MGGTQSSEGPTNDNQFYGRNYFNIDDFIHNTEEEIHHTTRRPSKNGSYFELPTINPKDLQKGNNWNKLEGNRHVPVYVKIPGFGAGVAAYQKRVAPARIGAMLDPTSVTHTEEESVSGSGNVYCVYKLFPFKPHLHREQAIYKAVPEFWQGERIIWPLKSAVESVFAGDIQKMYFITAIGEKFSYPIEEALAVDPKRDTRAIATAIEALKRDYPSQTGFNFTFKACASPALHIEGEEELERLKQEAANEELEMFASPEEMYREYEKTEALFKNTTDMEIEKMAELIKKKNQKRMQTVEKISLEPHTVKKTDSSNSAIARLAMQNGITMEELLSDDKHQTNVFMDNEVVAPVARHIGAPVNGGCDMGCSSSSVSPSDLLSVLQGKSGFASIGGKMKDAYCKKTTAYSVHY